MSTSFIKTIAIIMTLTSSCHEPGATAPSPGTFGYDLHFLRQYDSPVVLQSGAAKVIVSPKYQGKVFTSTASGDEGTSFGWVNYKAFTAKPDPHMNAFGGENRLWLGPEGGPFSLFFPPGASMEFSNWKTPAGYDTESWSVDSTADASVAMHKLMSLQNYAGTHLNLRVDRRIEILPRTEVFRRLQVGADDSVQVVGYATDNTLTNTGQTAWTETTGMPCIWMLDMFRPSPATVIVLPFHNTAGDPFEKVATTDYFGPISPDRLHHSNDVLLFKADGKSRGKLGVHPAKAANTAGSYDAQHRILTVTSFDVDAAGRYLNQEWRTDRALFSGDAVNAYNDGPLADGSQMGPFYEIESVSPAALLGPGQVLSHYHAVYHFTGSEKSLDLIARKVFGVSIEQIKNSFE